MGEIAPKALSNEIGMAFRHAASASGLAASNLRRGFMAPSDLYRPKLDGSDYRS